MLKAYLACLSWSGFLKNMESFQENLLLYNITAGIVVLVLFLLILKFIESLGKTLLIFVGIVIVGYGLMKFFPKVTDPVTKFIGGSWANDEKSTDTDESSTYDLSNTYQDRGTYHRIDTYPDGGIHDKNDTYDENSAYYKNSTHDGNDTDDKNDIYDDNDTYH